MAFKIRQICEVDANDVLNLSRALDEESRFMMFEPGERKTTLEEQLARIQQVLSSDNSMTFVIEKSLDENPHDQHKLVGLLGAQGGAFHRNHDTVSIFIGILQAYTGLGLGRMLFEEMEKWARSWGAHRLELTVMAHNTRGLALYTKMGFEIEGRLKGTLKVDGEYVDELMMSKILE